VRHRLYGWVVLSTAVGLIVGLLFLWAERVVDSRLDLASSWGYPVHRAMRIAWPSSVWLMATEGIEGTLRGNLIVSAALVANATLYGILGAVLWVGRRTVLRRTR
jgi:hypothetical protein